MLIQDMSQHCQDPPAEAPVADGGEPLEEDRLVPRDPDEAVVFVDGTALTINSSLRALRAGCDSFGLSKRGSKQACLKRMLDHIQTQTLLSAHGAEVRLKSEAEREARSQSVPKAPTPQEVQAHNLTHEPYKPWCDVCVSHRARQDAHPRADHEHVGHSVISYDFGFCTRLPAEDDKQTVLVLHDRDTKLIHAIPTLQKGGKQLQYLVRICAFHHADPAQGACTEIRFGTSQPCNCRWRQENVPRPWNHCAS